MKQKADYPVLSLTFKNLKYTFRNDEQIDYNWIR